MCGIAGVAGDHVSKTAEDHVRPMMADLARRGPDGEGLHSWNGAVLGHRRLAIFDLSDDGRQPMISSDGKIGVVFNGAIYNFRVLRAELERAGYHFRSQTDTEILIHGYREWGIEKLIERLRGMFAIGLWDYEAGKLFLLRDRLGVKPLIYAIVHGRIAFASTVRALRSAGFASEIDPQAIAEFLEYGYVTDDRTIYRGVHKVPAGHWLEWANGTLTPHSYWRVPEPRNGPGPSFEEAVEETERLFLEAVRMRLDADVPVGALLSGGVDSSLVCWAVKQAGADITAFTVGTPGDSWDETPDAVATARGLGIRHQVIELSPDQAPSMQDLISAYGEPFACASALGMIGVSQAVKPSATVLLTGDGGDDVFLGYPEHLHFWRAQQLANSIPSLAARSWYAVRPLFKVIPRSRRPVHFLDYATGGMGAVMNARDGLPFYELNAMLGERLAGIKLPDRQLPWTLQSARRVLTEFLDFEHRRRFVGEYMTKVDGGAMYYALEARSPFLDQEIWNFAATLPYETRLRGGRLKAILRELARRRLGERVSRGAKRGFSIPVQRWLIGKWKTAAEESFRESSLAKEGWICADSVVKQFQQACERGFATNHLWYCYVLESWFREQYRAAEVVHAGGHV
jgi:asparagine synthase (glutamine-hydrolysing)